MDLSFIYENIYCRVSLIIRIYIIADTVEFLANAFSCSTINSLSYLIKLLYPNADESKFPLNLFTSIEIMEILISCSEEHVIIVSFHGSGSRL